MGLGFSGVPLALYALSVWAGRSCLGPGTAPLRLLGVRAQGVSLISVQAFCEANPGHMWCVGLGLGGHRKLRMCLRGS